MNDALQREIAAMSNHLAAINARWNAIVDLLYDEWKAGDEKRPERKDRGVPHDHRARVGGCFRCDIGADEAGATRKEPVSPIQDTNISVQVP